MFAIPIIVNRSNLGSIQKQHSISSVVAMSHTHAFKDNLNKFNEQFPKRVSGSSRTREQETTKHEVAMLKMINSLNLVPSGSDCGDDGREGDEAKAVKAMKPKQATKAMKVKK